MAGTYSDVPAAADRTGAQALEAAVMTLQNYFQRNREMQCLVIVDPQPSELPAPKGKHPLSELPRTVLPVTHEAFPESERPYLLALNPRLPQFGAWLAESVRIALADRRPDVIARVPGQRIGGWLATSASADEVAAHLSRQMLQTDDRGKTCALRFYDSRALALLWPAMTLMQKETLLGPVKTWHAFDAVARLTGYSGLYPKMLEDLSFKPQQWSAIRRHGLINRALALHIASTGQQPEACAVDVAVAAAARAEQYELIERDDKLAFIGHALSWHPHFDAHPRVREVLRKVSPSEFYVAAVDELAHDEIEAIRDGAWYVGKNNKDGLRA